MLFDHSLISQPFLYSDIIPLMSEKLVLTSHIIIQHSFIYFISRNRFKKHFTKTIYLFLHCYAINYVQYFLLQKNTFNKRRMR